MENHQDYWLIIPSEEEMEKIRDTHIFVVIIFLMIMRVVVEGKWFGCVVIAGLLISLFDIIKKIYMDNMKLVVDQQKMRYAIVFIVLNAFFLFNCILLLLNAMMEICWLNATAFLDEITLLTLLLTLPQRLIIEKINKIIRKEKS